MQQDVHGKQIEAATFEISALMWASDDLNF
jgi:hypothetical protein